MLECFTAFRGESGVANDLHVARLKGEVRVCEGAKEKVPVGGAYRKAAGGVGDQRVARAFLNRKEGRGGVAPLGALGGDAGRQWASGLCLMDSRKCSMNPLCVMGEVAGGVNDPRGEATSLIEGCDISGQVVVGTTWYVCRVA